MKNVFKIKNEAQKEAYRYFDQHIRPLAKTPEGKFKDDSSGFVDNDADAFRHAYVSGVFVIEIGSGSAAFWGFLNEVMPGGGSSGQNVASARSMDFWNNKVGRKYGKKAQPSHSVKKKSL